jgi:CheY-like chemotaxis protein
MAESGLRDGPILVVHLQPEIRRLLTEVLEDEGHVIQETALGATALRRLVQTSASGMIVYLEPLLLHVQGNEQLHDYVMGRGVQTPHIFILLAAMADPQSEVAALRADGYLAQPFTIDQLIDSVADAQRTLQAKQTPPTVH